MSSSAHSRRRVSLPVFRDPMVPPVRVAGDPQIPCLSCGHCCTYVAVGVNAPTSPRYASDMLWYLYHEHVTVHRDVDGDWSVVFATRCRNLGVDLCCGVYAERPHICRVFDESGCEVNAPDSRDRVFETPTQFLEFLRSWRPKTYARIETTHVPPGLRLAPLASPPTPARSPRTPSSRARRSSAAAKRR